MKHKPWWLLVILISTVQLILLLIAVSAWFTWIRSTADFHIGTQNCLTSEAIANQVSNSIVDSGVRNIRLKSHPDHAKLQRIVSRVCLPDHGLVWIVDPATGNLICDASNENGTSENGTVKTAPVKTAIMESVSVSLSDLTGIVPTN